ncbi:HAD family hydrolase [Marinobacterium rhizophilum]|uniref:HAD family hydrolase n=1 Tax=Marinobacterium rhizophilum TaxID=420402 RepID=A0ABY5HIZ2_9GAMM|nr:HAD family hydrolase [Marinobacterium rhizophilum]UTW11568.1 HAD family hydrolase [Marinobacterium rhizophilum]
MALAIFDLDETLVACDSCSEFSKFMVAQGLAGPAFDVRHRQMMALYGSQQLVLSDYIRFFLAPLSALSCSDIQDLLPGFVEQYIVPKIYPQALQTLGEMRAQGHRVLIVSATAEFIVRAIATKLGVEDVLAIELAVEKNHYSGEIKGVPTFREGKVIRLQRWLSEQNETMDGAYFYSDSINDLPLLEQVDYPVVANADLQLQRIAEKRQWPAVNWAGTYPENEQAFCVTPLESQETTHV